MNDHEGWTKSRSYACPRLISPFRQQHYQHTHCWPSSASKSSAYAHSSVRLFAIDICLARLSLTAPVITSQMLSVLKAVFALAPYHLLSYGTLLGTELYQVRCPYVLAIHSLQATSTVL